jgi:hypothetical protein
MRQAVIDNPKAISTVVADRLQKAFYGGGALPAGSQVTMRAYLEHRSSMTDHQGTANWTWAAAGARDALAEGRTDEALARLDLLCVAAEQLAMDRGQWVLARELLFDSDPPYHAWAYARLPDPMRNPHPAIADERWCSVAEARLRELEDWKDRRNRLMIRRDQPVQRPSINTAAAGAAADSPTEAAAEGTKGQGKGRKGERVRP